MPSRFAKRLFFLCLGYFIVASPVCFSQVMEWRPVSPSDLQTDKPLIEADAPAEYLFWEERIERGFSGSTDEVYVRAKVFDERGVRMFSTIQVEYDSGYKLSDFRVRLIPPNSATVELGEKDIISNDVVRTIHGKTVSKAFVVPNVEIGSIVEYRYRLSFDSDITNLTPVLRKKLPVRDLSYYIKASSWGDNLKIMRFNVADYEYAKTDHGFIRISVHNARSIPNEPRLPPTKNLIPFLLLYSDPNIEADPDKYWKKFAKNIYSGPDNISKSDQVKKLAGELTAGLNTPEEKIASIFKYCRTRIRNFTFESKTTKEELEKIEKKDIDPETIIKKGESHNRPINKLFASLAAAAGFEVRSAFTGDRRDFFFLKQYAHSGLIFYSGMAVKVPSGWYFCNPGEKFVPGGHLYWFSEGQDVLLIGNKDAVWAKVPISGPGFNRTVRKSKFRIQADGSVEGRVKTTLYGFTGENYKRDNFRSTPEEIKNTIRHDLNAHFSEFELEDVVVKNIDSATEPVEIEYRVKVPGYAQPAGKRLLFKPAFFSYDSKPIFMSSNRRSPIYFELLTSDFDETEFELPDGFDLETVADVQRIGGGESAVSYGVKTSVDPGGKTIKYLRLTATGENGRLLYPASSYAAIKDVFDKIAIADSAVISLRKKE